jgi:hypothetical protein
MLDLDHLPPSSFLTEREVASVLGIQHKTLTTWRHTRAVDIPFLKLGGAVRYRVGDVRNFIEGNMRNPSGQRAA